MLAKLLAGVCEIRPFGSRYGMGHRLQGVRQSVGPVAFGLLDGDFQDRVSLVEEQPRTWTNDGVHWGWRWERKEIENYLLDPKVVRRALGPGAPQQYDRHLVEAASLIAPYQAARTALAAVQAKIRPLETSFGRERGRMKHIFPDRFDRAFCREQVEQLLSERRELLDENRLPELEIECESGQRHRDYLTYFAGKDLLWAMDQPVGGAARFLERILVGIQESTDAIDQWLPEWAALRRIVAES